jgi:hypothetical protein
MKLTVGRLRQLFAEAVQEAKIGAAPAYLKKEAVREALQKIVIASVESGDTTDQKALDQFFADIDMSTKALKMVPFDVWKKMSGTPLKKR